MKAIKIFVLGFLISKAGLSNLSAQGETASAKGIGIALKSSTNGLGCDVVYSFHERMSLRFGYEQLHLKTDFSFNEESVDYDANANYTAGSLSLLFDYYFGKHFFLTAGAGWNMFHAEIGGKTASSLQYGDIQISKDKIGGFNFQIDPALKLSPYFGMGFGRTLGLKKKVGFAFEMGGYYQGSPDISITSSGLLSPTSNPDQGHEARLEKQINQYSIYPVMKFSLSYKIAGL